MHLMLGKLSYCNTLQPTSALPRASRASWIRAPLQRREARSGTGRNCTSISGRRPTPAENSLSPPSSRRPAQQIQSGCRPSRLF
ncbi:hypothetical protein HBI56_096460 [Parastagonospora nodorum]|uniref:Uncharacterized protein n=1 Tax=Phaeosphaeria nodorum (strain SN15 / ATCC MYA-4574 / FGSC 10173) TaxID=321614 RepID=A0A7U2F441_PHANO|nr:hypothetical protein HBH82_040010 [Parastagonospora nodorum]QRC98334.1 hypothetical protein JI435_044080 [Parastagonospora nodorum SN15]KAH4693606.1 hypothetical protein HBH78_076000 [Parastagonospora nodorum]KAH4694320.1 hypothetical protein HBH67_215880 [Parastagonospora nodorum]KAH4791584.1 hypothetical protein HBH63_097230 [Parastagonospora nodorum]